MEDINLLKQENEKLNNRLKTAVQVFNEQKATIQRLTSERDTNKVELDKREAYIKELEAKVKENNKDDEFFAQVKEIDDLKTKCKELNDALIDQKNETETLKSIIKEVKKAISVLK